MKILMLNHTLDHYAGTETFTYTLACQLRRLGHEVICFSPQLGRLTDRLREADVAVSDDLADLPGDIDVIHAHHRHESLLGFAHFPDKPMLLVCHGVLPWQEQPFRSRLNIDHLLRHHRIDRTNVQILRNGIDLSRFTSRRPIRPRPQHALVLSNYMPDSLRGLIERVCGRLGITVSLAGGAQSLWAVEEAINRADLVFALGRSALEALACKRAVIVLDYNGADGLVTPQNFNLLRLRNFSGRTYRLRYSEESLLKEIGRYDPTTADPLYELVRREHDVRQLARQYVNLYEDAMSQPLWGRAGPEELALRQYRAAAELIEDANGLRTLLDARTHSIQVIHESRGWRTLSAIRRIRQRVTTLLSRPISSPRKARILVVDDDPLLLQWLIDALASEGHQVDTADNGRDALQRLEHRAYDLILSDLRMPHMDGVEFYRRLERDRPETARHVMFLSGHVDASEYEDFLGEVRDRSLTKPVDLSILQHLVRQGLSAQGK